ncbi:transporter, major facilitator family protein [Besnoitia besnoiti]|uniref:Transporter, major facilitator family protein n=1 Tax=Besnoitia besnoiti TaxID=94643 RepID=A0A2A9MEK7_BESBE|nr:transporter, major facilitator family protein [Besnoitia besnoiti]PFH36319.1 transporter, major facilitator family protein [Besnoitia besnoiti]
MDASADHTTRVSMPLSPRAVPGLSVAACEGAVEAAAPPASLVGGQNGGAEASSRSGSAVGELALNPAETPTAWLPSIPLLPADGLEAEAKAASAREPVTGAQAAAEQRRPFNLSRYVLLVVYVLYTFASARVLFGWPNLSSMLFRAGAFSWLCRGEPLVEDKRYLCRAQDSAVQFLFTVGIAVAFCFSLGAGLLMDFRGPKVCACVGQLMNTLGWILLGVAGESCQTYIPGVLCLALGADAGYLPALNISNLFPGHEGLVIVTMSAAMSASFSVPTIMDASWRSNPNQSFFSICLAYALAGTGLCFLVALFLFPAQSYKSQEELAQKIRQENQEREREAQNELAERPPLEKHKSDATAAQTAAPGASLEESMEASPDATGASSQQGLASPAAGDAQKADRAEDAGVGVAFEAARCIPFSKQIRSPYFYCFYIYWPLNALFYNFYMTSAENLFNAEINDLLGILGPLSMIPSILLGKVADMWGVMSLVLFIITSGVLMYAFAIPKSLFCYYVSAVFSCLYLSNFSGQMYAYMGDTFRSTDFGKVVGVTSATGGLLSLLRIPLHDALTVRVLDGDYFYACVTMLGLALICFCLALHLFFLKRRWPKAYLTRPAQVEPAAEPGDLVLVAVEG